MPGTKNVDPDVCKARGRLGTAVRIGDEGGAKRIRLELHQLQIVADAKRLAARLPELDFEKHQQVRAILLEALAAAG
jgi:hypothetical protein